MGLLKKNLIFTIVVAVCILTFGTGAILAFVEAGKINSAKQEITGAKALLNNIRFADPAPTEENVEAAKENVKRLATELEKIREDLERGSRITTSTDGIGVMAGIQQYISEYRRKAAERTNRLGEPTPIDLPTNFAFGFEQYVVEATPYDDKKVVAVLDKQRQILSYLLNKLFEADPESIVAVKREVLEPKKAAGAADKNSSAKAKGLDKGFEINPAISAKVPGAVDTLAFSLTFTGYTDSLRDFLNNLAKFDLPIVVRSIEVKRPSGQSTTTTAPQQNNLDSIFSAFGGGEEAEAEDKAMEEAQKPVISENISIFTVVLEFIEIVLPAELAEDNV